MNNIIDFIDKNQTTMIEWVFEFFNGKYSKDEVSEFLYYVENGQPRKGVVKLANEFTELKTTDPDEIRNWYTNTDFYVFDLLPWNGSGMFKEKADRILELIQQNNFKTVVDFGGGLGVLSTYIALNSDCKVHYVDLPNGVTFKFAKFLFNKFNVTDKITVWGDTDFFESTLHVDCILATDCFEHIPNMEETFDKLIEHSHKIFHDSTFFSDQWSPQHVYTPSQLEFVNMCALRNYIPSPQDVRLLNRVYLSFSNDGNLKLNTI